MSDSEDDYMSESFLKKIEDNRPGLVSKRTLREYKIEQQHKHAQVSNRIKPKAELEREHREKGLEKAISSDNKGFSMLQKMGFKPGMALGKLGTGVTTYALHPGVIHTELMRYRRKGILVLSWYLFRPLTWLLMKSTIQGIQTTIYCAVSEDLEGVSGRYYSDCKEKQPNPQACDDDAAVALWELSEKLTGLSSK